MADAQRTIAEQVECDSCGEAPAVWWSDYDEGYCLKCFSTLYEKTWAEIERLTTTLDAIEKALSAPTHLHRYNKDIHSSECFACRLREWVAECLQGAAEGGPS